MRPHVVLAGVGAAFAVPLSLFVVSTISSTPSAAPIYEPSGDLRPSVSPSPTLETPKPPAPTSSPNTTVAKSMEPSRPVEVTRPVNKEITPPEARPSVQTPRKVANSPVDGWRAPQLAIGSNDISAPFMKSGARANAMVACIPSSACAISGSTLVIGNGATNVTVQWSSSGNTTWHAWSDYASIH